MIKEKKILCLSPHPDDVEFGCGGSLNRWVKYNEIIYVAFSPCNKSLPSGFAKNSIYEECDLSTKSMGLKRENVLKFQFPVRDFPEHRQEILEEMVKLNKSYSPDIVLMPNGSDIHQDHHQIHLEGKRAFKNASILGYELPWNNFATQANFFVKLDEVDVLQKLKSIACYQSQKNRIYASEENIKSALIFRGMQAKTRYAECFEVIRWLI